MQLLSSEAQEQLSKLLADQIEELARARLGLLKEQNRRRLMTRAEAARYVHLSGGKFDDVVRPYVKPVSFEGLSNWYIAHFLLIVGLGLVLYRVMVVEPPYWEEEEGDVDSK